MKLAALLTAVLLAGSMSFAADMEKKEETKVDTSKNPITGTVTKKKKYTKKDKGAHGTKTAEVTEKTKTHTDGEVEKTVEVKTDAEKK